MRRAPEREQSLRGATAQPRTNSGLATPTARRRPRAAGTAFRDLRVGGTDSSGQPLRLDIEPKKGRALLFFPSDAEGTPDERTLHA